jgi:cell division cycle 2-like protein
MEQFEGQTLEKYIFKKKAENKPFEEQSVINIMKQLLNAVVYIHSNEIMHRDLKPGTFFELTKENILIRELSNNQI